ncbi:hypothetical protein CRG98_026024 [Punica granatum]|uniref:Uncharacterized protein n=1 Tax=Punica granatum TaxID=22663 RepID=A0A2I0JBH4_PUNGR|nr:hypothetical protein CRG98_026024 [Punica granatum]
MSYNEPEPLQSVTWFLDTGASNHMCGRKEFFAKLDKRRLGNITFGDLSKRPIEGKGDVIFELNNGKQLCISDVYYVPDIKSNLLSIGQLLERGYDINMKDSALSIRDKNDKLITHEEKRTKLEDKSQKCIFLGYGENSSGYKLYNPVTHKIVMSRDVKFDEEQTRDWKNNDQLKQIALDEEHQQKNETLGDIEEALSPRRVGIQSDSDGSGSSIMRKTKSIQEIYDSSRAVNSGGDILLMCLYVDDLVFTGNSSFMAREFKQSMEKEFEMTDLGLMRYFLGIEVQRALLNLNNSCCKLKSDGSCIEGSAPCLLRIRYASFDGFHPTEVVNVAFAAKAYNKLSPSHASPYDIRQLALLP